MSYGFFSLECIFILTNQLKCKVVLYVDSNGAWKWNHFVDPLPQSICHEITHLRIRHSALDKPTWPHMGMTFLILNKLMTNLWVLNPKNPFFGENIWSLHILKKIWYFIWIFTSNCLLTNIDKSGRHLTMEDHCERCLIEKEDSLHKIRGYPIAI